MVFLPPRKPWKKLRQDGTRRSSCDAYWMVVRERIRNGEESIPTSGLVSETKGGNIEITRVGTVGVRRFDFHRARTRSRSKQFVVAASGRKRGGIYLDEGFRFEGCDRMESGEGFESCARGMFGVRRRGVSSVDARVVAAQASNLYHVARSTYESSRGSMPPTSFVNASTGLRLRICTWKGAGNGEPTVMLFHGACDDARVWDGVCKRLCASGMVDSCIGPDMRGHGGSERSSDPTCDAEVLLQDALSIAIERDLYRAPLALVGVGEGACVAIKMAALYPRLVGSVVCIDYAANVDPPERHPLQGKTWKQPAQAFLELLQDAQGVKPESIAQLLDIRVIDDDIHGGCRCRMDPGWCFKSIKEERKRDLAALTCPLLLIRGERSSVIREEDLKYTQELASQSPFCKIHTVNGYDGHLPVDCPGKLSRTLERWLRKTEEYYMVRDPESRRPELLNIRPLPQYNTIEEAAKALRPRAIPTPSMIAEELAKLRAEDEQSSDSDSDEDHLTSLAKEPAEYFGFVG